MKLLKLCIDESIRNFDLMAGDEKYKSDFANGSKSIERAYIFKKNLKGRILYYFQSHK
jgi:CelD/BcsL family acetyltransferase involved in cellulose biosynthesis